jgi:hypothetical protein
MDTISDSYHRRDNQKLEDFVKVTGQKGLPKNVALVMHT